MCIWIFNFNNIKNDIYISEGVEKRTVSVNMIFIPRTISAPNNNHYTMIRYTKISTKYQNILFFTSFQLIITKKIHRSIKTARDLILNMYIKDFPWIYLGKKEFTSFWLCIWTHNTSNSLNIIYIHFNLINQGNINSSFIIIRHRLNMQFNPFHSDVAAPAAKSI